MGRSPNNSDKRPADVEGELQGLMKRSHHTETLISDIGEKLLKKESMSTSSNSTSSKSTSKKMCDCRSPTSSRCLCSTSTCTCSNSSKNKSSTPTSSSTSSSSSSSTVSLIKHVITRAVKEDQLYPGQGIAVYERSLCDTITRSGHSHSSGKRKETTTWCRTTRESIVQKKHCCCKPKNPCEKEEYNVNDQIVYPNKNGYTRSRIAEESLRKARQNLTELGYLENNANDDCHYHDSRQETALCEPKQSRYDNQCREMKQMEDSRNCDNQCGFGMECCGNECGGFNMNCSCCFCQYLEYCLSPGETCWCCGCDINCSDSDGECDYCDCNGDSLNNPCCCEVSEEIITKNCPAPKKNCPTPKKNCHPATKKKTVNYAPDDQLNQEYCYNESPEYRRKDCCKQEKKEKKHYKNKSSSSCRKSLKDSNTPTESSSRRTSSTTSSQSSSISTTCSDTTGKSSTSSDTSSDTTISDSTSHSGDRRKESQDRRRSSQERRRSSQDRRRSSQDRRISSPCCRKSSQDRGISSPCSRKSSQDLRRSSPCCRKSSQDRRKYECSQTPNPKPASRPTIKFYAEEPLHYPGQTKITLDGPHGVSTYLPKPVSPCPQPYPCAPAPICCPLPPPMCCPLPPPCCPCPPMCCPNLETTQYLLS